MEWRVPIISGPVWFANQALVLQVLSGVVLLVIALRAWQFHRISKNPRSRLISIGILLLSFAFLLRATLDFAIFQEFLELQAKGIAHLSTENALFEDMVALLGIGAYRFLTLTGLFSIYSLHQQQTKTNSVLVLSLIAATVYASLSEYYVFHVVAVLIAGLICMNFWKTYRKTQNAITLLLLSSFGIIALSQAVLIFKLQQGFFLIGTSLQVLGYVGVLATLFLVRAHGNIQIKK